MNKERLHIAIVALWFGPLWCWTLAFGQVAAGGLETALAKRLLNEGWERSPRARTEAQAWFESAPADIRANSGVRWAYALNRIHHRKFRDAKPLVEELAPQHPSNWDIRYAQIWLATFVDEFEQSLALMQQLKKQMDATGDLGQDQKTEAYFRMGRLIGYMQGPFANRVNRQSLETSVTALLDGAGEQAIRAFTQQRVAVIDQYETLMATRDQKQEKEMETLVRKQQVDLEQQTSLVDQLKQQSTEARSNREKVVGEGQAEIDGAKAELDSISAEWNRQQSIIISARLDLDGVWLSIAQIDDALLHESDPVIRHRLLLDRNYFLLLAREKESYLYSLRADANAIYSQLGSASANYDRSIAKLRGRVNEIDQMLSSAESSMARANRRIRGLQSEPKVSNTLVATIDATAEALTNYDPFPTDVLKQRLLDALQNAPK